MEIDEVIRSGNNELDSTDNFNSKTFILHIVQLFIASALLSFFIYY
jgi:hypothetical protein